MGIQRNESSNSFNNSIDSIQNLNGSGSHDLGLSEGIDQVPLMIHPKSKRNSVTSDSGKGVTLSWHDLSVYVPVPSTGFFQTKNSQEPFKRILNNVAGIVEPGSLMAVMGASGAGKTTLLNVLAKRTPGNVVVNGDIRVNGIPLGNFMRKLSGYVYQEDLFIGSLTVREHLNFMARMKLDRRLTKWERERRIEELLVELGLKKCENTKIGIPNLIQGLSGGEKKRLSFASEVISGCPMLFADECTTGLDSYSAQRIVRLMKMLAAKGTTIICTIHQPSSQVFAMFDQVCLLAEGRTAYLGSTKGAMSFLSDLGFICPEHFNPADFYIRTLAVFPGKEEESKRNITEVCDAFANSKPYKEMEEKISEEIVRYDFISVSITSKSSSTESISDQTLTGSNVRKPLWPVQLYWLTWRAVLDSVRNPKIHMIRTGQKILLALLVGFCFFGVKVDQKGIQDIQGAIFVFITENTFPSMYGVLHVFPYELPLFLRENKNGLYRVDAYYIAKMISLVPGFIVEPLIFVTIAYWMVGMRATISAFLLTSLAVLLTANTAAACGCFFSAAFDKISFSIACLIPFDYMLMTTGGLFINLGTLPGFISWTKFMSWFMYANEAISVTQWSDISNITCAADPNLPCLTNGPQVLAARNFNESNLSKDFIGIISLYCIFHTGAFFALLLKSRRR